MAIMITFVLWTCHSVLLCSVPARGGCVCIADPHFFVRELLLYQQSAQLLQRHFVGGGDVAAVTSFCGQGEAREFGELISDCHVCTTFCLWCSCHIHGDVAFCVQVGSKSVLSLVGTRAETALQRRGF